MFDSIGEVVRQILSFLTENKIAIQVDPFATFVALLALATSVFANRRAGRALAQERRRAGKLDRVSIQEHSTQGVMRSIGGVLRKTPARQSGGPEGFVCSVFSGATEAEVEAVSLNISFFEGLFGQRRYDISVDLRMGEGLVGLPPVLPLRMPAHSRTDWTFPTFLTLWPARRGRERVVDVGRVLRFTEQLRFEFAAYSRADLLADTAVSWHRRSLLGFPLKGGPWTRTTSYASIWEALMAPACPDSIKGWFLEWLECRSDFESRLEGDPTDDSRRVLRDIRKWMYWPPGRVMLTSPYTPLYVGLDGEYPSWMRTIDSVLRLPSPESVDRGEALRGPGGSNPGRQARIAWALGILAFGPGTVLKFPHSNGPNVDERAAPDPILAAARQLRGLLDKSAGGRTPSKSFSEKASECSEILLTELQRCTLLAPSECHQLLARALDGSLFESEKVEIEGEDGEPLLIWLGIGSTSDSP